MLAVMLKDDKAWLGDVKSQVDIDERTKNWKKEVREWAYNAEDVLDDWNFKQLRAEVEVSPVQVSGQRNAHEAIHHPWMGSSFRDRVKAQMRKRGEIRMSYHQVGLDGLLRRGNDVESLPTSSLLTEREIHGREDDKGLLVGFLLRGALEHNLSIVPVLGPSGIGKTTLLRDIYNDQMVSEHFNSKAWICASGGTCMTELMMKTGECLTGASCNYTQLAAVQKRLKQKIDGQRFLLILDDVRREIIDGDQWETLSATFSGCAWGSVVVLTAQDDWVADRTKTVPAYILESLSRDHCWSVFQKHAFSGSLPTDDRLVEIGLKIAKECEGLPMVAKALGVRLRHERDVAVWEEVLLQRDEVVPDLKLSYHRLPAHLKRCFVYCSVFPKGYLFSREELIRLWMAQGFVKEEMGRSWEDAGIKYFDDLSIMSFFQQSELDAGAFVMPKLLRALAQSISDGECVTVENNHLRNSLQKARHLSLTPSNGELSVSFLSNATKLRSFLVVPAWPLKDIAHVNLPDSAFHSLNHLRALDLRHTDIRALPDAINKLKRLRYLNLSGTKIESINASVCQLYLLQTLDLSSTEIRELPDAIGNLVKLRHLHLNVTKITKLPESISNLPQLQTLHLGLTEIQELSETIGSLKCLKFLCLNVSKIQRLPASICDISKLEVLELQGGAYDEGSDNGVMTEDRGLVGQFSPQSDRILHNQPVSDMADSRINSRSDRVDDRYSPSNDAVRNDSVSGNQQSHLILQEPVVSRCYHGEGARLENTSFSGLTSVALRNCTTCMTLPQLGQLPFLKELFIDGVPVEQIGNEFCGRSDGNGFPSLEKLSFLNMSRWREWGGVETGDFSLLKELIIFNCPILRGIPCLHSPLTKLKVERCAAESIPTPDSLQELELLCCDNLVALAELPSLSSLCKLTLMYCQNLTSLPAISSNELNDLWIEECEKLDMSFLGELEIYTLSSTTIAT